MSQGNASCVGCDLYIGNRCIKFSRDDRCDPSTRDWLSGDSDVEFITVDRMCRKASIFGNDFIGLTSEDIERLKTGEIIHISGEYGIFIGFYEG